MEKVMVVISLENTTTMMNATNIAAADMLDIVFDGRNKAYGAYQLRRSYNKRLATAMGTVLCAALLIFCTSMLANGKKKGDGDIIKPIDLTLTKVEDPKPVIPPPVQQTPPPRQMETVKITVPNIVPDEQVKPEDMPPPNDVAEDAKIGLVNVHGDIDDGTVAAPPDNPGTGLAIAPVQRKENTDSIYYTVQNPAEFPGGLSAWKRYLERNLIYPENAIEAETQGAIKVQFIVDREGNISDVHAINDLGNGLAEEAVRIIKSGPRWKPAEQNGTKVIYRHVQNITFKLN